MKRGFSTKSYKPKTFKYRSPAQVKADREKMARLRAMRKKK